MAATPAVPATVGPATVAAAAVTKATVAGGTSGAAALAPAPAPATAAAVPASATATGVAAATVAAPTSRAWVAAWVDRGAGIRTRGRAEEEDREDSGKVMIVFSFLSFPGLVPWVDIKCPTELINAPLTHKLVNVQLQSIIPTGTVLTGAVPLSLAGTVSPTPIPCSRAGMVPLLY